MQRTLSSSLVQKAFRCLVFLFLFMFSIVASHAQSTQQFTGHVTDSTGAVVKGAEVVVHNQATGVDTKTVTTSAGAYTDRKSVV